MTQVLNSHLTQRQTFPNHNIIALRVTEEANYRGICFQMDKNDEMKLYCPWPIFFLFLVYGTNSDTSGWTITRCQVLEEAGKHTVGSTHLPPYVKSKNSWSPYNAAMIVPLIAKTIAETPMASNQVLHQILELYKKPYCFTEAIIHGARMEAGKLIFGNADNNVGYAHFVKDDLEKAGHYVSLSFTSRRATMQNLDKIIIADKVLHQKNTN